MSHYFTRNGIDDAVIYHIKYGISGAGYSAYIDLILIVSIGLLFSFFGAYIFGRWLSIHFKIKGLIKSRNRIIAYSLMMVGVITSPTTYDLWKHVISYTSPYKAARLPFSQYYLRDNIVQSGEHKRNLLYIYVEGLERTYFNEKKFPGLIKELRYLENNATTFTNIEQVYKTGWTIGGVTASQCGIPLITPSHGNSMNGVDTFLPEAKCLGDYLSSAGYKLSAIMGSSKEFSGLGKMFQSHGFSSIYDGPNDLIKLLEDPSYRNGWGLYDDTLFKFADQELLELNKKNIPYALFLSTMDTHHPKGHPSKFCDGIIYQDGTNPILNAVACSDKLVGNFVNRIIHSEYADNLVIVIASDHLAMGNTATDLLNSTGKRRNLFMILESKKHGLVVDNRGSMLDVGSTLLPFLGFEGDIGLGRDLNKGATLITTLSDFGELLKGWEKDVIALWRFPKIEPTTRIHIDTKRDIVNINGRELRYPLLIEIDSMGESVIRFNFNKAKEHKKLTMHLLELQDKTPFLWIDFCKNMGINSKVKKIEHCVMYGEASSEKIQRKYLKDNISILGTELYEPSSRVVPPVRL